MEQTYNINFYKGKDYLTYSDYSFDVVEQVTGQTWKEISFNEVMNLIHVEAVERLLEEITETTELIPPLDSKLVQFRKLRKNQNYEYITSDNIWTYFYGIDGQPVKSKLPSSFLNQKKQEKYFKRCNGRLVWC